MSDWEPVGASATVDGWETIEDKKKKAAPEPPKQSTTDRLIEELFTPTEVAASLATGAVAPAIGGWAGIAGSILPGPEGQGAAWSQKVTDALTYSPKGKTAQAVTGAISYPFEKFAEGANWAGEKTTDITGSPLAGTAVTTGIQSLPLIFGNKAVGGKLLPEGEFIGTAAKREAARVGNLQADTAAIAAADAGFKLPPTQVNPTLTNRTVEGFLGGKIKTAQDLSKSNQALSQAKIRKEFNLSEEAPLNPETFDQIRRDAGAKYEAVRNTGKSAASGDYAAALAEMETPIAEMAAAYPKDAPPPILKKIEALKETEFNADAAISKIRDLRNDASAAARAGDKGYAAQLKSLANTVEAELDRHLQRTGQPASVLQDFRDARKTIAKAYTAEKYITPAGEVNAAAMARELKKGTPLEGGMREVAEFGANFPKAAQLPSKIGGVPMSPLDFAASAVLGIGSFAAGHPWAGLSAVAPFMRPYVRKMIGSDAYQNRFVTPPDYAPSLGSRFIEATQNPYAAGAAIDTATEARERKRRLAEMLKGR